MSRRAIVGLALLGIAAWLAGMLASFPAARALAWSDPSGIEARGVDGSVWSGRAARVTFGGPAPVTDLRWDIAAWRLVTGRLAGDTDFRLAGVAVDGRFAAMPGGRIAVRDATVKGPIGPLAELAPVPVLALDGDLLARIDEAVVEDRRPRRLRGRFQWEGARMIAPVQMELGTVQGRVAPDEDDTHTLTLESRDGQVTIDGRIDLTADGRYRVALTLTPAADAPARIGDTLGMVAEQRGGEFVIRRSGQLR